MLTDVSEETRVVRPTARPEILATATLVLTIGLLILGGRAALALGWIGRSQWTGPVPAAGVAFVLCAIILLAQDWQRRLLARAATLMLLFIVLVRLVHYAFEAQIKPHPDLVAAFRFVHNGMATRSAELFFVVCVALGAYEPPWRSRFRAPIVAALATLVAAVSIVHLGIGQTHPSTYPFGWEYFMFISAPTVIGFLVISIALFSRAWTDDQQIRPAGPSWIPIPIAAVLIVATLVLWRSLRVEEWDNLQAQTQTEAVELRETVMAEIKRHMNTTIRIARRWEGNGYTDRALWDMDAKLQLEHSKSLHALGWVDANLIVRWTASRDPSAHVVGSSLASERHRRLAALAAMAVGRPVVSKPISLRDDGTLGFLVLCPIWREGTFDGLIVAAFRYRELFEPLMYGRAFGVEIADGSTIVFTTGEGPGGRVVARGTTLSLDGTSWSMTAWPTPALYAQEQSPFPNVVLVAGLCMTLLVAIAVALAQTASQRAGEARKAKGITEAHARRLHAQSEQLAAARDAAVSATSAKSAFLATMSHEIRTPMNGVLGTVSLLLDTPLSTEQREYADQVRLSADTLLRIIDDILDFSKAEAGRLTLDATDLDLRALVEDAADLMGASSQHKGLELAVLVEPDVPQHARGDGGRLRQVLLNLLSNAIKFTSAGIVTLRVSCDREVGDTTDVDARRTIMLRFTVTDTGIGVGPDALGRLFASFSQADSSTTRRYGGSGLGLAIVRQLAELMGGSTGASSEEGRGSTFWFTARLDAATGAALPALGQIDPEILTGVRVLVADDQLASQAALCDQLRQLGASTDTAATAAVAVDRIDRAARVGRPYGIALIDESIAFEGTPAVASGASGFATINPRVFPAGTVAFLTTPRSRSSATDLAVSVGYQACVTKPARRRHLEALILGALGRDTAAAPAARTSTTPADGATTGRLAPIATRALRVLVAEDNEINQKVIVRMLQKLGHQADVVVNGSEAVRACAAGGYDLVLMDCQMPELDGYDATRQIRQQTGSSRRVPIVALTADAATSDRDRCLAAGMDDFLGKPVRPPELARTLERWTARTVDDRQAV